MIEWASDTGGFKAPGKNWAVKSGTECVIGQSGKRFWAGLHLKRYSHARQEKCGGCGAIIHASGRETAAGRVDHALHASARHDMS